MNFRSWSLLCSTLSSSESLLTLRAIYFKLLEHPNLEYRLSFTTVACALRTWVELLFANYMEFDFLEPLLFRFEHSNLKIYKRRFFLCWFLIVRAQRMSVYYLKKWSFHLYREILFLIWYLFFWNLANPQIFI